MTIRQLIAENPELTDAEIKALAEETGLFAYARNI